ncbi:hypothetical protein V8E54_006814 [Elaphomyces granulatus]
MASQAASNATSSACRHVTQRFRKHWDTPTGEHAGAKGRGKYQLRLTVDGLINEYLFSCVYQPDVQCNLLTAERIKEALGPYYDSNNFSIRELDTDRIVGTTETRDYVLCIRIAYNEMDQILIVVIMATIQDYASSLSLPLPKEYVDSDKKSLRFLHIDIQECKPTRIHGYKYALMILDDRSRCLFVQFLRGKSEYAYSDMLTGEDDQEQDPRPQIWRDDLDVAAPEVTVNHLRVWPGCPAYVNCHTKGRSHQSSKMAQEQAK